MEQTWRWYGPDDPVTLSHVKQAGATGIVTALHHIPLGEVWPVEEIAKRDLQIKEAGLVWSVVESIPVHEAIKTGKSQEDRDRYISNYQESMRNLKAGSSDARILCYNFMPVVDWTRTDLEFDWPDGSKALKFDMTAFAAFDMFILMRSGAKEDYKEKEIEAARAYFDNLSPPEIQRLSDTITMGLPGRTSEAYDLQSFKRAIAEYEDVDASVARANLKYFIQQLTPLAEELGMYLAIHPDDPPRTLLGLPRVVSTSQDIEELLGCAQSPHNGITMCVGSYASRPDNDILAMIDQFRGAINFVHLRNVRKLEGGPNCNGGEKEGLGSGFVESDHLDGDVDMFEVIRRLVAEKKDREANADVRARQALPMRPDHGHQMLSDLTDERKMNPGYTGIGRLRGLAELRGLQAGIVQGGLSAEFQRAS